MAMDDGVKIRVTEPGIMGDEPIEEFDNIGVGVRRTAGGVADVVSQVVRLGFGVATLPLNLLPNRSRYHAKNSIREGFLAVKTLIDDVTDGIDTGLSRSMERDRMYAGSIRLDADTIPPADPM